ncbi:hypothetical protein QR680_008730 [Steinernema hermaphroditum]|uniref:Maelstrom domain-containing protein n=1 Tax=Steinernema hermaphroditum TaxID=289476 RepID=A0AA39M7J9_9BILA|nr:hypothetical protein QR680_008730 [Steinernema hermaphroditum]
MHDRNRPKHPGLIRIRPEYKRLQQFLETKYDRFGRRLAYPVMSFNFLAVPDEDVFSIGPSQADLEDGAFGVRFTLRHGVLDVFHLHDISESDPNDISAALRKFLEKAFEGEPIICAEGQREAVARFLVDHLGGDFEKVLLSVYTIYEVEICLFNKCCHQFVRHYGQFFDENIIYQDFLHMKRTYGDTIPKCCRTTVYNTIFDIYHICKMANLSSNIYFGDMMVPGPHMFALLFAYPGQIYEEMHAGNRLWDSDGTAVSAANRRNNDPSFVEGPHGGLIMKKKQGYVVPGGEYMPEKNKKSLTNKMSNE